MTRGYRARNAVNISQNTYVCITDCTRSPTFLSPPTPVVRVCGHRVSNQRGCIVAALMILSQSNANANCHAAAGNVIDTVLQHVAAALLLQPTSNLLLHVQLCPQPARRPYRMRERARQTTEHSTQGVSSNPQALE